MTGGRVFNAYRGRSVAVLGATGFIGRWVVEALARENAIVHLIVRDHDRATRVLAELDLAGEIFVCDAGDARSLTGALRTLRPAVTFNVAGYGIDGGERREAEYFRVNAESIAGLCRAVAASRDHTWGGQALVHVGSQLEYGPIGGTLPEGATPAPTTVYGQSKLEGTRAVAAAGCTLGLPAVTARLFNVYGPGEHRGRLLPSLIEAAATGMPLNLTAGAQKLDFVFVEDVAEGLLRLGLSAAVAGEVVNLGTGRLTSVREFALTAAALLELPEELLLFGAIAARAEEIQYDPVAIGRMRELTGWTPPTTVADGIRRTLQRMSHVAR